MIAMVASVLLVGTIATVDAFDRFVTDTGSGKLNLTDGALDNSVKTLESPASSGCGGCQLGDDSWTGTGEFTIATNDEYNSLVARTTEGSVDSNAAPSMSGFRGLQDDKALRIYGAECGPIIDGGSQIVLYNCDRATDVSEVYITYKGQMIQVDVPSKGNLSSMITVSLPLSVQFNDPVLVDRVSYVENGYVFVEETWKTPYGPAQ